MSVLDALTGSSVEDYDPIDTIGFSDDSEMIVILEPGADANAVEILDSDGALVQGRFLYPAQWTATLPLRKNQPVKYDRAGGGSYTLTVPRSERQRLDLDPGDPLEPGDYQVAIGQPDGPTQRRDITISAEVLPDD